VDADRLAALAATVARQEVALGALAELVDVIARDLYPAEGHAPVRTDMRFGVRRECDRWRR
jgi:hypothetical protein